MDHYKILDDASHYALRYLEELPGRRVFPGEESLDELKKLDISLPELPVDPKMVLEVLDKIGSRNTVASNGGRYFGFIFGGALPVSLAASWLATAWDQNAVFKVSSPIAAQIEKVTGNWLLDLFQLPANSAVGFVTGTTMANFCGVVAARDFLWKQMGWDVKSKGMIGAPLIKVVAGEEVHASMLRALQLAGFGSENITRVPADDQGRMRADKFPETDASTLVCVQAGNVNTGGIDPLREICTSAKKNGSWVHVDGAFGLWARVSPEKARFIDGCDLADSWAVDLHKWLNVPYDSGAVICRNPKLLQNALAISAAYLPDSAEPDPFFYTPEMSRRARGIDAWAALYSMGRQGVRDLIERCCNYATLFSSNLSKAGFEILNEVTLNQALVSFGDAELTNRIIKKIQDSGTCWCGGTVWKGKTAMRISVSSWMTTEKDIGECSAAIIRIANEEMGSGAN
jgi:glutamate/tyrosine decarboxylase-like PLP-dependent enzyme